MWIPQKTTKQTNTQKQKQKQKQNICQFYNQTMYYLSARNIRADTQGILFEKKNT